jgi:hydrogenase maturation protease
MILIAGVGNIFFGDDAFGSEVARRLAQRSLPENVQVVDFGIRGLDLVYALLNGYDGVILIDATTRGGTPGTLYVIEPDLSELGKSNAEMETHGMDPLRVLALAHNMGADLKKARVVGCEPVTLEHEDGYIGLSPQVAAAVEQAIGIVESLIQEASQFQNFG